MKGEWSFTHIDHEVRKRLNISFNEYAYLDYIYKTQRHEEYGVNGWCITGNEKIAQFLGLSKGAIVGIGQRMEKKGLLVKSSGGRKKATKRWSSDAYEQKGQKMTGGGQKVTIRGSENGLEGGQKVTHNISIENKENISIEKPKNSIDELNQKRKEDYLSQLQEDTFWLEQVERVHKVKIGKIPFFAQEFCKEQIALDDFLYPVYKEFKKHLYWWIPKNRKRINELMKPQNNQDNNTPIRIETNYTPEQRAHIAKMQKLVSLKTEAS